MRLTLCGAINSISSFFNSLSSGSESYALSPIIRFGRSPVKRSVIVRSTSLTSWGEDVGVDLWNYQTSDGRGIRKAIDFLYPFLNSENKWKYQQIEGWQPERLFPIIRRAKRKYNDEKFAKMYSLLPNLNIQDRNLLLY